MFRREGRGFTAGDQQIRAWQGSPEVNEDGEIVGIYSESENRRHIEVVSAKDVAELLRISQWMVYELVKRDEIPHVKIGRSVRFIKCDVINWMRCKRD